MPQPSAAPAWRLPAFLDARRLEGRIVRFFLVLLLIVQAASYLLVERAIEKQVLIGIDQRLASAQFNLRQELQRSLPREQAKAAVLAQDKGFVDAVGALHLDAAGPPTLHDALDNLSRRAGARLAAYIELQGPLEASDAERAAEAWRLAQRLPADDAELGLALVQGEPLQLVRVPVRVPVSSPQPTGELLLAFRLRPEQLVPLKQYGNVNAAVALRSPKGWGQAVDAEGRADLPALLAAAQALGEAPQELRWQAQTLRARRVALPAASARADEAVDALLWVEVDEELAPARALRHSLLLLNLAGVALFALGSVITARWLSGPIQQLRDEARRLGGGDLETPVDTHSGRLQEVREVRALAESFEAMRVGLRTQQADIRRYAYSDRLTGLANRAQFLEQLSTARRTHPTLAVLVLNLDRFKPVNDLLGRELGDRLLMAVAERLRAALGPRATEPELPLLARLGGDEFGVCLAGDGEAALALAARIHAALAQPVDLERRGSRRDADGVADWMKVDVGASIGIALFPLHHQHPDDLIRLAERAMDLAKRRRDGTLMFEIGMDPRSSYSLSLRSELHRAIRDGELRLYLQPKLNLANAMVEGAEALVRWQHPEKGMVPPGAFIPFAEETGFVRELTQWVLRAGARLAAEAARRGLHLRISVNFSTMDLLDVDLLRKVEAVLVEESCAPEWLCLEITESAIMSDPQRALETVKALAAAGFRLAIDDFGTGYSSLAYLKQLPVQELKIDQSFVFGLEHDENNRTIVESTIKLAKDLGKAVVAEGIETEAALRQLTAWGCDEGQGYYIARPMPAEQLLDQVEAGTLETRH